jgi:hypothetical protein
MQPLSSRPRPEPASDEANARLGRRYSAAVIRRSGFWLFVLVMTIGLSAVALHLAAYIGDRPRRRQRQPDFAQLTRGDVPRRTTSQAADSLRSLPPGAPASVVATSAGPPTPGSGRRALVTATRSAELVRQSDERAFIQLGLADDLRDAIRRIDREHEQRVREALGAPTADQTGEDGDDVEEHDQIATAELNRARVAEIKRVLGEDHAREFSEAEVTAASLLRKQLTRSSP